MPPGVRLLVRQVADDLRPPDRDLLHFLAVHVENHAAEDRRHGIIEVHDRFRRTTQGLEGPLEQFLARLAQDLDLHPLRNAIAFDQAADEIELGIGSGWETNLDLLEARLYEHVKKAMLLRTVHRDDQDRKSVV